MRINAFLHHFVAVPVCKVLLQLTKPTKTVTTNIIGGLEKVEKKYLQLPINQKVTVLAVSFSIVYGAGLWLLSYLWYKDQKRGSFHFFNDNAEWKQMDKLGHFLAAFYISHLTVQGLQSAGLSKAKALQRGGWAGGVLMTPIELLDGFSEGYGASWGDEVANFAGSAFYIWQQKTFGRCVIQPKFQFLPTHFAVQRPQLLGKNLTEQWLKDYNGQTYWYVLNSHEWIDNPILHLLTKTFQVAVGYGASNMIYARDEQNIAVGLVPYRKFYIAILLNINSLILNNKTSKFLSKLSSIWAVPLIKWQWRS